MPTLLTLAALLTLALSAHAEVAVIYEQGSPAAPRGPFEARAIVEDGDPIGAVWQATSPGGGNRHVLNPGGLANGDGGPSSIFNLHSGLPIVAWAQSSPGGFDVVVSRFENGAWTAPEVLAEDATVAEPADPFLVVDPADGSVHVLYWTDDAWPRVMHRQAPADLSTWSAAVQVSAPAERAVRPSGTFHQGTLHVAYESHTGQLGGTPRQIVHAWDDGAGFASEVIASTDHDDWNRPLVHGAGAVLWIDWLDAEGEMTWTRKEGAGAWEPVNVEPFSGDLERDYVVRETIERVALD